MLLLSVTARDVTNDLAARIDRRSIGEAPARGSEVLHRARLPQEGVGLAGDGESRGSDDLTGVVDGLCLRIPVTQRAEVDHVTRQWTPQKRTVPDEGAGCDIIADDLGRVIHVPDVRGCQRGRPVRDPRIPEDSYGYPATNRRPGELPEIVEGAEAIGWQDLHDARLPEKAVPRGFAGTDDAEHLPLIVHRLGDDGGRFVGAGKIDERVISAAPAGPAPGATDGSGGATDSSDATCRTRTPGR